MIFLLRDLIDKLRQLFGHRPVSPRPPCRLTEDEALSIARAAAPGYERYLAVLLVVKGPTGVEWLVASETLGHGAYITIADSTGQVIRNTRSGRR